MCSPRRGIMPTERECVHDSPLPPKTSLSHRVEQIAMETSDKWMANPAVSSMLRSNAQGLRELVSMTYVSDGKAGTSWYNGDRLIPRDNLEWEVEASRGILLALIRDAQAGQDLRAMVVNRDVLYVPGARYRLVC